MPKYYPRAIQVDQGKSFFLFGPRGTGKTTWLKQNFKDAVYIDLLRADIYANLLAYPENLINFIPRDFSGWIIIDEIQRVPELLNEVHRLIEEKRYKFILTGSSARKLRRGGVNLLAGRALTYHMYPLTAEELGDDFDLLTSLRFGNMPSVYRERNKKKYLESYVSTYIVQEVLQEGLTRNLPAFSRFLQVASFSQGSVLNVSNIAKECSISRKIAENYFSILEDLLIAYFLPPFTKKARRRNVKHNKFYYFDVGVYRTLRPKGPLDLSDDIDGVSLETLVLHELKAMNEYHDLGYQIYFWRTHTGAEVDFVLYGERNFLAVEVKKRAVVTDKDLAGLRLFLKDYPQARGLLLYGGSKRLYYDKITVLPLQDFFANVRGFLEK